MPAVIDKELCVGCEACVGECPVDAIEIVGDMACVNDSCIDCGACVEICPADAITMQ